MVYLSVFLFELPYGSEFTFRPNGPVWVKCSEVWINRFNRPVISAFQGNHFAWHSDKCKVFPIPLQPLYDINEQLSLF